MIAVESPEFVASLISWLLTYMVHSTVLLGLAWVASRSAARHYPGIMQLLWRAALIGAVLSATVQSAGVIEPISGSLTMAGPTATAPAPAPDGTMDSSGPVMTDAHLAAARQSIPSAAAATPPAPRWHLPLALLWLAGAVLALSRLNSSAWRLRRLMQDRRPFNGGRFLHELAHRMGLRRRVRLSLSDVVPMPFATGILRPEICLPRGLATELGNAPSQALVAHEMAHLAHRDPAWQVLHRLIAGCLFFQPLNRVARRHLEHAAELLADDKAVACTGRSLDLARCLVDVAERISATTEPLPASAALGAAGGLDERVKRLLKTEHRSRGIARWAAPLLAGMLAVLTFVLPGVSLSTADARDASDSPRTVNWSDAVDTPEAPEAVAVASATAPAPPHPNRAPSRPAPAATTALAAVPNPAAAPAPPAPPSAAAIELEAVLEQLRACERELHRLSEGLESGHEEDLEELRAELQRVRDHAVEMRFEERAARERSRELVRSNTKMRDEQRRMARDQAAEARRQVEIEKRALNEQRFEAKRRAAEAERMSHEQRREFAAQARAVASAEREEARRLAEVARRLEREARRKALEEKRRRTEEERAREDDDGSIPK